MFKGHAVKHVRNRAVKHVEIFSLHKVGRYKMKSHNDMYPLPNLQVGWMLFVNL